MQNRMRVLVAAALVVVFALTQMCAGELTINKVHGETPEHIGSSLMDPDRSDIETFVTLTEIWTMDAIKYQVNIFDRRAVKSAQTTINDGYGDCSERAQVMHAILDSQGIPNTIIWGDVQGTKILHAAVEVYYDGKTRILGDMKGFQKKGTGLHPSERPIE
jgi:hypothetical protein